MRKKFILLFVGYVLTFAVLFRIAGYHHPRIPVLMYHAIDMQINDGVHITPEHFEQHIQSLKKAGYQAITIEEFNEHVHRKGKLPKKPVLITFDDGYENNYQWAYPILKKYDMKATLFVITSRILEEAEENLYPHENKKINWQQAREMKDVISIQSHTWDLHYHTKGKTGHQQGAIYGPAQQGEKLESKAAFERKVMDDFILSRQIIKEKTGMEAIAISYPYGNFSEETMELVKKSGFKIGFAIRNKVTHKGKNPYEFERITVNGNDTSEELLEKMNPHYY